MTNTPSRTATTNETQSIVSPVHPPARYCGGKSRLARTIIGRINAIPHKSYAEPFLGMGGIFFRRDRRPTAEVINDRNGEVANFFRVLQRHYGPLMELFRFQLTGRQEFDRLKATDPATLTDLERAARFLYLQRAAYGGKVVRQAFGVETTGVSGRFNIYTLATALDEIHRRLAGVVIECLPYHDFIDRYDHPTTLFYLDPPYWGMERHFGKDLFDRSDFAQLAEQLRSLKGRFILSLNDRAETRALFGGFTLETVSLSYSVGKKRQTPATELIITNQHR